MKTVTADFQKRLKRVRRLAENGNADRALAALQNMQKTWRDHPVLLVEQARLIQLSERGNLHQARRALARAAEVAADSPEPWIELGHYLYAIDDRGVDAEAMFDRAMTLALGDLSGALAGKIQSVLDRVNEGDSISSGRATELVNLLAFAQVIFQRIKPDSLESRELGDAIAELQERIKPKRKSERNGK
jgi:hypothetical protein